MSKEKAIDSLKKSIKEMKSFMELEEEYKERLKAKDELIKMYYEDHKKLKEKYANKSIELQNALVEITDLKQRNSKAIAYIELTKNIKWWTADKNKLIDILEGDKK